MKIITGKLSGRNFFMPADIEPTQNVVRKAVFDILGHDVEGLEFLELFAGSGAVSLEALSCGAKKVTMVEHNPKCMDVIRQNLQLLGLDLLSGNNNTELIEGDAFATTKRMADQKRKFDMIFLDPPYGLDLAKKALKTLSSYDILHPDCFLIIQHSEKEFLPESEGRFSVIRQRKYGRSLLTIYKG